MKYLTTLIGCCVTGLSAAFSDGQPGASLTSDLWTRELEDYANWTILPRATGRSRPSGGDPVPRRSPRNLGVNRGRVQVTGASTQRRGSTQRGGQRGSSATDGSSRGAHRTSDDRGRTRAGSENDTARNGGQGRAHDGTPNGGIRVPRRGGGTPRTLNGETARGNPAPGGTINPNRGTGAVTGHSLNVVPNRNPNESNLTPIYNEFERFGRQAAATGDTAVAHSLVHTRGRAHSMIENSPPIPDSMWTADATPGHVTYRSVGSQGRATAQAISERNGGLMLSASATKRTTSLLSTEEKPGVIKWSNGVGQEHKLRVPANSVATVEVAAHPSGSGAATSIWCSGKACAQVQAYGQNGW